VQALRVELGDDTVPLEPTLDALVDDGLAMRYGKLFGPSGSARALAG
jgi:hypothetical protein